MPATGRADVSAGRWGRVPRLPWVVTLAGLLLTAALVPALVMPAVPVQPAWASERGPSADRFRCDAGSGIWRKLTSENHDNLLVTPGTVTAAPGETVLLTLTWEWRDWRPGAPLTVRACVDVDATADGRATAPFDDQGGGPADVTVVHPSTEPSARMEADVDGGTELRPAVEVPVSIVVPADATAGSEVCVRSAVFGDPADHRHSPPLFDVSETVCITVVTPTPTPPVTPTPTPPMTPSPSPTVSPTPSPTVSPTVSPSPPLTPPLPVPPVPPVTPTPSPSPTVSPSPQVLPTIVLPPETAAAPAPPEVLGVQVLPPEVLGVQVLPRTGAPIARLAVSGLALVGLAVLAWRRGRRATVRRPSA